MSTGRPGASDLDGWLKRIKPGEKMTLSYFRNDTLRELEFEVAGKPDAKWTVRRVKEPTDAQKAAYESWLGQKWP